MRADPSRLCDLWKTCPHFYEKYYEKHQGFYETCHGIWNFNCPLSPGGKDAEQSVRRLSEGEAR